MPRIPEATGPRVAQRSLPDVRLSTGANADTFGAGIARAVSDTRALDQLGRVAAKSWLDEQEKIRKATDDTWVAQQLSEATKRSDRLLFGDPDAGVDGFYNLKGLDAANKAKEMPGALERAFSDLINEAPSEEARQALQERLLAVQRSTGSEVARHAAGELNSYRVNAQVDQARVGMDSLLAKYTMPAENLERDFDALVAPGITEAARLQGKNSTDLVNDARGKMYAAVIEQNLNAGNKEYGKRLMDRWADGLPVEERAKLLGTIRKMDLQDRGDDTAQVMLSRLESGETESAILKDINAIEDRDLRRYTMQSYRAFSGQIKYERRLAEDAALSAMSDEMDGYARAGDFRGMQKYVQGLDPNSKVGRRADSLLSRYASNVGMDPDTDFDSYTGLAEDIALGKFRDANALKADERWDSVFGTNRKQLTDDLEKKSKVSSTELLTAYKFAIGTDGDPNVKLSDTQKKDALRFREWAEAQVAETKRGDDPEYANKLAAAWVMSGERKGGFALGYGEDLTYGAALRDPEAAATFLPDLSDTQKAQVDAVFGANPDLKARWVSAYGGNPDRAARAYYMEAVKRGIGKRQKEQQ